MEISSLTQKSIKSGIKNGWTADDFCEKYQCSPEELKKRISQLYKRSANEKKLWTEMETNAKKNHPKKKKKAPKSANPTTAPTDTASKAAPLNEDDLDMLRAKEKTYSDQLMSLESEFYELKNQHVQRQKSLRETEKSMKKLRESYVELAASYESISAQANAIAQAMDKVSTDGKVKRNDLMNIRQSIEALETVTLCVFNSGEITVESSSAQAIKLDKTGHEELYDNLAKNTLCDDLRQKDVKILARLLAITENIAKETNKRIEVICDNEELEMIFQQLTN